ncbi:ABC transporter ATP-binding protein [Arsenicicoccus dermatophilus]|uniref:ABC transporter ATP-binding protein n=1 Tax=Arsenicicoccus dermatophilus TaxID=1076331 RepID=UPI003917009E
MTHDPAVRLDHLVVRLGRRTVLEDVSCELDRGITAFVGPNGAGKSTLLRTMAGALPPCDGEVAGLGEHPYADEASRRRFCARVGWMPQSAGVPPRFTVRRLVEHSAWIKAMDRAAVPSAVARAMEVAQVTHLAERPLARMSGGERQRSVLAACLVNDPGLLVLDEPTVGLDPGQRETFQQAVRVIGRSATVVLSTHILEDVFGVADRVVGMRAGRIDLDRPMSEDPSLRADVMALFREVPA